MKTTTLSTRVEWDIHLLFSGYCKQQGKSESQILRKLISDVIGMKNKKESMYDKIFYESMDLDFKIQDKACQLVEALKKHKISNWKTKNNESTLIIELDILLDDKYQHLAALEVVEELEKKELRK